MSEIRCLEGSFACSEAVKRSNVDVICAYPITPQTHIVESLAQMHADGEMDAEFINCESEHSALSICAGASATGARTFTATAGQGLALMHEILFISSAMRLPIVMAISNRALSAPLSIWGDHSDTITNRDCGWMQIYCENSQEIFDSTMQAYKIAENSDVMLPIMVNMDGFTLSHLNERAIIEDRKEVEDFVGDFQPKYTLHPDKPVAMGCYGTPDFYMEFRRQQDEAMKNAAKVIPKVNEEFLDAFGRGYGFIEEYRSEDADVVMVIMGALSGNAKEAVDKLREDGKKFGLVKLRVYRPFPKEEMKKALKDANIVGVIDRHISLGFGAPVTTEIRTVIENPTVGFVAGLGGREVTVEDFEKIFKECEQAAKKEEYFDYKWYGVRE